ncbi:hypothetical protein O4328_29190 [Rhodococcus opacus]|uniref:Zinc ribbon domain-containing protein n=1 Tax=Rhodococcus opacus TaxID=37919 RepID=A0AAX3YP84_RHOOP|nr:hypothetical protein [Rhodococcus opacus]MCZ4587718.1 hypothetical protein [Rhodococcus opacus]WLF51287.1 hypothetical protein Q5707_38650 [Rhodococcus opacus]
MGGIDTASDVTGVLLLVWIVSGSVCGVIAGTIAGRKNRDSLGFFLLGLLFPVIGVVAAILAAPGEPLPPLGMRAVTCPRCNTRQNVNAQLPNYECWQCKLDVQLPVA